MQTTSAFIPWNLINSMKRQKDTTLKDEPPQHTHTHTHTTLVGVQYATGEEQRNSSKKNEEAEPQQKWWPVVNVSGGENKVQSNMEIKFHIA